MTISPEQTKVEAGGSYAKAEVNDRTPLYVAILAWGVAMLALGVSVWGSKSQDEKIRALETQVLLLREDVRQATIEAARK